MMLEASYKLPDVKGLAVKAQVAFDKGAFMGINSGHVLQCHIVVP